MHKLLFIITLSVLSCLSAGAQDKPIVSVSTDVSAGGGDNNPFWLVSNKQGLSSLTPNNGYVRGAILKELNRNKRFDYAYGVDLAGAWNNTSVFVIQQLYGEIKYRSLFLSAGSKERVGEFSNPDLSSGDVTISGNARPVPQIRAGFNRWVSPFKSCNWFALKGEIAYGWFTDKRFQEKRVNKEYGLMSTGVKYHHKAIYFKFGNEQKHRWLIEAGYVLDSEFGGKSTWYKNGQIDRVEDAPDGLKEYAKAFFPMQGSSTYYEGNYVGGWQIKVNYKINNDHRLRIGMENIFDDASSMGKLNGFDGLWSLEYNTSKKGLITSALIEYFQTTNQSGPLHWYPSDNPTHSDVWHHAPGADNYYNNYFYSGWSHWGQALGNPLITSPLYNKNNLLSFANNRVRAFHGGVKGEIIPGLEHRVLLTYMKGWGTPFYPFTHTQESFSGLIEFKYQSKKIYDIALKLSLAADFGNLLGDNFGVNINVSKSF